MRSNEESPDIKFHTQRRSQDFVLGGAEYWVNCLYTSMNVGGGYVALLCEARKLWLFGIFISNL